MIERNHLLKKMIDDPGCVADLKEEDITDLLRKVHPFFKAESALVELEGSVTFTGDLHGDFLTTQAIVHRFFPCDHLVFLGDYIDREPIRWGSLLTMTYLLILKWCFPKKFILLKGNHECNYLIPCVPYEFETEIIQRFDSGALHERFVEVFREMPLMIFSHGVFAAHGGIIKGADLRTLKTIGKNDGTAVAALVWSDPVLSPTYRGVGERFDEHDLHQFLEGISAKVFVRGHDYKTLGYSIYGDRCLTLFSSSRYKEEGNGGILVARADKEIARASDLVVEDYSKGHWNMYQVARL
jgi:hypothetical protein